MPNPPSKDAQCSEKYAIFFLNRKFFFHKFHNIAHILREKKLATFGGGGTGLNTKLKTSNKDKKYKNTNHILIWILITLYQ